MGIIEAKGGARKSVVNSISLKKAKSSLFIMQN
jgi:uncharacterized protein Veg